MRNQIKQGSVFRTNSSSGFSLIEVAIALVVIGLLMLPILAMHKINTQKEISNTTKSRINNIEASLNKYVIKYGHYPPPADRNVAQGATGFGISVTAISLNCSSPAAIAGSACVTNTNAYDVDTTPGSDDVLIGDIPFATLGIRYDNILDGYGRKMIYAVSKNLTTTGTFSNSLGAIEIKDFYGASLFPTGPYAHFVIISTGKDGRGSFSLSGNSIAPCGGASNGVDYDNCNLDASFWNNYQSGASQGGQQIYEVAGTSHYDDYVRHIISLESGIWTSITSQPDIKNTNTHNIMIGAPSTSCGSTCATLPVTRVDVSGSVRATNIKTGRLCNNVSSPICVEASSVVISTASDPVPVSPEMLAGSPSVVGILDTTTGGVLSQKKNRVKGNGILCPTLDNAQLGMFGFNEADENCSVTAYSSTNIAACPATQFAVGIKADGSINCQ